MGAAVLREHVLVLPKLLCLRIRDLNQTDENYGSRTFSFHLFLPWKQQINYKYK